MRIKKEKGKERKIVKKKGKIEEEEQKQWDLTDTERMELEQRWFRQMGANKLLIELQQIKGEEIRQEMDRWEQVKLAHKIPHQHRLNLLARWRTGKVWVRGQVKELDDATGSSLVDNPTF